MRRTRATDARFLVDSEVKTGYGEAVSVVNTCSKCETSVGFSGGLSVVEGMTMVDYVSMSRRGESFVNIQWDTGQSATLEYTFICILCVYPAKEYGGVGDEVAEGVSRASVSLSALQLQTSAAGSCAKHVRQQARPLAQCPAQSRGRLYQHPTSVNGGAG